MQAGNKWEGDQALLSWKATALHFLAKDWAPSLASALLEEATLQLQLKSHIHPEKFGNLLTDVVCNFLLPKLEERSLSLKVGTSQHVAKKAPGKVNGTSSQVEFAKQRLSIETGKSSKRKKGMALTPSPGQRHKKIFPGSSSEAVITSLKFGGDAVTPESRNGAVAACDWSPEDVASIIARYTYGWDTVDIARIVKVLLQRAENLNCWGAQNTANVVVLLSELSKNALFTWGINNRFIHLLHHMNLGHEMSAQYINIIQCYEQWDDHETVNAAMLLGAFFVSFRECVAFYGALVAKWPSKWVSTLWNELVERGNLVHTKTPYEIMDLHCTLFSRHNTPTVSVKVGLHHCLDSLQLLNPSSEKFDEVLAREITFCYNSQQKHASAMVAMSCYAELEAAMAMAPALTAMAPAPTAMPPAPTTMAPTTPPPSSLKCRQAKSPKIISSATKASSIDTKENEIPNSM